MNNLVPVTVFDRTNDLLKEPSCVVFRHLTLFDNVIEQLATRVFNHHDDIGGRRNHFVSSNKKRKVGVLSLSLLYVVISFWAYSLIMCGCRKSFRY